MSKNPDDEVFTIDEVFRPEDEPVRLLLDEQEWELIIALAEAGGQDKLGALQKRTGLEPERFQELLAGLAQKGIVKKGAETAGPGKPLPEDEKVSEFLASLRDKNHYQALGLAPDADLGEVRRAYFRLMHKYHPDRFMLAEDDQSRENLKELFRVLTRAYETLSDPKTRREYDLSIPEFTGADEREDSRALESLFGREFEPESLPEASPELARSFYENALVDFEKGDLTSAELNFKLAAALDPEAGEYQEGLTKTRRLNNRSRAKESAIKALFFEEEGRLRLAIRFLRRAAELDPERPEYHFDLARLLLEKGADLAEARTHIVLAIDLKPGRLDQLLLFAKIQEKMGEFQDARRTYKKILSLDRENREAQTALKKME